MGFYFFFSSRRRHTRFDCDWSSDVCSSDLLRVRRVPDVEAGLTGALCDVVQEPRLAGEERGDSIRAVVHELVVAEHGLTGAKRPASELLEPADQEAAHPGAGGRRLVTTTGLVVQDADPDLAVAATVMPPR